MKARPSGWLTTRRPPDRSMRAAFRHAAGLSAIFPYIPFIKMASKLQEAKSSAAISAWKVRTAGLCQVVVARLGDHTHTHREPEFRTRREFLSALISAAVLGMMKLVSHVHLCCDKSRQDSMRGRAQQSRRSATTSRTTVLPVVARIPTGRMTGNAPIIR